MARDTSNSVLQFLPVGNTEQVWQACCMILKRKLMLIIIDTSEIGPRVPSEKSSSRPPILKFARIQFSETMPAVDPIADLFINKSKRQNNGQQEMFAYIFMIHLKRH